MKLIASARLRKAENALYNTRPYLEEIQRLLGRLGDQVDDYVSPLGVEREVRRVAVIVFGSDDGLCGSFNVMLFKKFQEVLADFATGLEEPLNVYPVGKKIRSEMKKAAGINVMTLPPAFAQKEYSKGVLTIADELIRQYIAGEIDRVEVVYARFKSIGTQVMTRMQLLPWKQPEGLQPVVEQAGSKQNHVYIYEPDATSILEMLYPLVLRVTLLQTLLENQTSEQAARIVSMQIANDNARKLLKTLQLEYNKLRQQGITAELLDIAGGAQE